MLFIAALLVASGLVYNLWNMPHLDVQAAPVFEELTANAFVDSSLINKAAFLDKYMENNGESKVIVLKGSVQSVKQNLQGNSVIMLSGKDKEVGVQCVLLKDESVNSIKIGESVSVKGIVRSGAEYDEDLDLYEDAILDKCSIIIE